MGEDTRCPVCNTLILDEELVHSCSDFTGMEDTWEFVCPNCNKRFRYIVIYGEIARTAPVLA